MQLGVGHRAHAPLGTRGVGQACAAPGRAVAAVALTDHDGMYGVVRFAEAAREWRMPTVYGAELSLGLTAPQNGVADPEGDHLLVLARDAVEAAKKLTSRTAVRAPRPSARAAHDADALLALLSVMRQRRTDAAREASRYADQGMTQEQISQVLGIDQSSVSRRLRTALWYEESEARTVLCLLYTSPSPRDS